MAIGHASGTSHRIRYTRVIHNHDSLMFTMFPNVGIEMARCPVRASPNSAEATGEERDTHKDRA
jgi:hypothetical protein